MKQFYISLLLYLLVTCVNSNFSAAYNEPVPLAEVKWPLQRADEVFSGPGVFKEVKKTYFIKGSNNVPLSKLVNLSIFRDFRPNLTYEQAVSRYGRPTWSRTAEEGKTAVYDLPVARIELEDHTYPGSFFFSNYERRTVYAYPKPFAGGCLPASTIFSSAVNILVPSDTSVEIHISDADCPSSEGAFVFVKNGCVRAINWYKVDGSGIPPDVCK